MAIDETNPCNNITQTFANTKEGFMKAIGTAMCGIWQSINSADAEYLLLQDDNGGVLTYFIRAVELDEDGNRTSQDFELDGTTPYTPTGTVTPVLSTGGGGGGDDVEVLTLFDDNGGVITPFLRQYTLSGGAITSSDTQLDGTTAYSVAGTVRVEQELVASEATLSTVAGDTTSLDGKIPSLTLGGGLEAGALLVTIASDSTGLLSVDDGGGSLTVDGSVSVSNLGTLATEATLSTVAGDTTSLDSKIPSLSLGGGLEAGALLVTLASDSTGVLSVDDGGGSLTVDGSVSVSNLGTLATEATLSTVAGDTTSLDGKIPSLTLGGGLEASALLVTIANDSTGVLSVDDGGGSLTVDGTVTANIGTTGGLALESTLTTVAGDTTSLDGKIPSLTLGGGLEASALLVTIANDSTGVLSVDDNGGSLSVDDGGTPLQVTTSGGDIATETTLASIDTELTPVAAIFDAKSEIAFGSIGVAFAIAHTPGGNLRHISILNDTDADIEVSFDAGTTNHWTVRQGEGHTFDLQAFQRYQAAAIHIRYKSAAPTTGDVTIMGLR